MAKRYPDYVQNKVPLYYMREELRKNAEYPARKEYETFSFSEAIRKLKEGKKVARTGWNGKGMYIWLLPPAMVKREWCRDERLLECFGEGENELN